MALTDICRSQLNDRNNAFPFYDSATATVDCNVAMTSQAVELWTTDVQLSAFDVRDIANTPIGPTGRVLAGRTFRFVGMVAATDYRMLAGVGVGEIRDLLRAGWFVVLFVNYGVIRAKAPEIAGDRRYSGAHAIGLGDLWRGAQGLTSHYYDPLNDGRRRGDWTAPDGVQDARFSIVRDAAYAYTGHDTLSGYAVVPGGQRE